MLNRSPEEIIAFAIALIPAFTFHEFAHAWVANYLGDQTAKNLGRLTLNPLKHLDVLGTIMVFVIGFGWAKPVPVNPANLRNGRRSMAVVAVAGPLTNLAIAGVLGFGFRFTGLVGSQFLDYVLLTSVWLNCALLFFNLIPIPPLDGYRVLLGLLPEGAAIQYSRIGQVGPLALFGLIMLGQFIPGVDILGTIVIQPTEALMRALLGT
ncbi:MAG: site-2 protease family protein [Anaerolineae bacterium]|nr:site-2 protease family protein [Anaerolineae bacterium]